MGRNFVDRIIQLVRHDEESYVAAADVNDHENITQITGDDEVSRNSDQMLNCMNM